MVTIINYKERQKEDGTSFFVLEVQGGLEMIMSKATGQFYATAKKAHLSSTFDEMTCSALIGTKIPGSIMKDRCEPFTYVVKETGEQITLHHRWVYVTEEEVKSQEDKDFEANAQVFSSNGALEYAM
ncbi:hypothetical protein FLAN108750_13890 [Flavobacterium antarcticum]|uniref:hypothetical protein n=1 Tax=Flavobacterium antarcticum TaxID=271155 RepID=UPI0003B3CAC5|nr:hypothetical protein [Flavobacterium antarcticum]